MSTLELQPVSWNEVCKIARQDATSAAGLILEFVKNNFSFLKALQVKINDCKVSLNSVNGFIKTETGQEYFFKFHSEEGEAKSMADSEYYQAKILSDFGLPVIEPLYISQAVGRQFVIYPKIEAPTVFEICDDLDRQFFSCGSYDERKLDELLEAERKLLTKVREVFLKSLRDGNEDFLSKAPINQLFYNRLVGKNGADPRLKLFYGNSEFCEIARLTWQINGTSYGETLAEIVEKAKDFLNPVGEYSQPMVVAHGDDHNGNIFDLNGELKLFDPAFAGYAPALLAFVKATAHNIFLQPFWLYEPEFLAGKLELNYQIEGCRIILENNWGTEELSPLRMQLLELYVKIVWRPLLVELKERNLLPEGWREFLRKAFFCCPFLVFNLLDRQKYSKKLSILALSKCLELGARPLEGKNIMENFLNEIEP